MTVKATVNSIRIAPVPTAGRILPAILIGLAALVVIGLAVAALSGAFDAERTSAAATPTSITPVLTPSAVPPAADRQALNAALQLAISENRIIAPIKNNAMTALRDLIALDPKDRNAQTTLLELFPFAAQAIEGSLERGELDLAEAQIALLGQTGHSSNSLLLLNDKLREQRSTVARSDVAQARAQAAAAANSAPSPTAPNRAEATPEPAAGPTPDPAVVARDTPSIPTPRAPAAVPPNNTPAPSVPAATSDARGLVPASAPTAAAPPSATPVETAAVQIAFAEPLYPPRARNRRIEGEVELAFTIDRNGEPQDIQVVRADPPNTFDREALRAAQRWRFEPGTVNGEPIEQRITRVLRFRLGEG
jgi:protein TonB